LPTTLATVSTGGRDGCKSNLKGIQDLLIVKPIFYFSCDEDLDECQSSPCLHDGFCQQTIVPGNYSCSCMEEYEGHNCEELKIKTCGELPCLNGGTCRSGSRPWGDDLYTCDCTTGFKVGPNRERTLF
jgi:hypothetical protein